jgi:hypothetical protein
MLGCKVLWVQPIKGLSRNRELRRGLVDQTLRRCSGLVKPKRHHRRCSRSVIHDEGLPMDIDGGGTGLTF